jgi:Ser/Thr protein kinase RdoA (MazF antagonist)
MRLFDLSATQLFLVGCREYHKQNDLQRLLLPARLEQRTVTDQSALVASMSDAAPYSALTPEAILDAVESCGYRADGRLLALASYENRVYQVWPEEGAAIVAKFYRPARWTDDAIREEHGFALELAERELPIVAPLVIDGRTLHKHGGFRFALYPRRGGRTPELGDAATLTQLGRFIARIHAVGALHRFCHRPALDIETYGWTPFRFVLEHNFVPADLHEAYRSVVDDVLSRVARCYERAGAVRAIRVHGDCHAGNMLWTDDGPHFVDLDDTCSAPAVQDIWLCLSGDRAAMTAQLAAFMQGYRAFHDFDQAELVLIEALRTLRLVNYAGWLARRWDDPAFPANFPFFNTQRYWQDHILSLREQAAALDEPPLELE